MILEIKSRNSSTLCKGILITIHTESNSKPKNTNFVHGPTDFSSAIGTPSRLQTLENVETSTQQ